MNAQLDIKAFLERTGWDQAELARQAKVHPVTLNRIIRGKRGAGGQTLKKLWPFIYQTPPVPVQPIDTAQPPDAA